MFGAGSVVRAQKGALKTGEASGRSADSVSDTFVTNFATGGVSGYCSGTLMETWKFPPSYGVPVGPCMAQRQAAKVSKRICVVATGAAHRSRLNERRPLVHIRRVVRVELDVRLFTALELQEDNTILRYPIRIADSRLRAASQLTGNNVSDPHTSLNSLKSLVFDAISLSARPRDLCLRGTRKGDCRYTGANPRYR